MKNIGIIAEYNPFHTGHQYQIMESRAKFPDERVGIVVVMSGNWVQQANCAICDKWERGKMAVLGGADLVIELPTQWATASAQRFARGAIFLLESTGLVSHLSFGSESGDISAINTIKSAINSPIFSSLLKKELKNGGSFPRARQNALENMIGEKAQLLSQPNHILGLEYAMALEFYGSRIHPFTIKREGAGFHDTSQDKKVEFLSATGIRAGIQAENWESVLPFLLDEVKYSFKEREIPQLKHCESILLYKIQTMTELDWARLPDSGVEEGLPKRCVKISKNCQSSQEFVDKVKTKRYTHSRIRRLLMWAFLGIYQDNFLDSPPYIRILAMNTHGKEILRRMNDTSKLPIITTTAKINQTSEISQELFRQEGVYTKLYGKCHQNKRDFKEEWQQYPFVLA